MAQASLFFILALATLHFASAVQRRSESGSTSNAGVAAATASQLPDCLMAYSTCLSELPCKISLDSLNRHCGSSDSFCNATKLTHCLSVLRTLENRSPFRNCTCDRHSDWTAKELGTCHYYSKLVRAHPCSALRSSSVRRNKTSVVGGRQKTALKVQPTEAVKSAGAQSQGVRGVNVSLSKSSPAAPPQDCYAARKACAADSQCVPVLTAFKRYCRPETDCADATQDCASVAKQLAARSPIFTCSCRAARRKKDTANDRLPDRCESVELKFQSATCLKHLGFTNNRPNTNCADSQSGNTACAKDGGESSDCYDAVAQCDGDVLCRTQLAKLLAACGADQCDSTPCRQASAEFYDAPARRAAHLVACRCNEARDRANCDKHAAYFRPCFPSAQQATANTSKATPTASASSFHTSPADKISTGYLAQERYPRDFCSQMQRYNRLSRTHRIYSYVNGSECSEVCNCSADGSYACRNVTCVAGPAPDAGPQQSKAQVQTGLRTDANASRGLKGRRGDGDLKLRQAQAQQADDGSGTTPTPTPTPAPAPAPAGLFLHVGYSVDEQRMLERHDVRLEFDSLVQKLTQLLNGETGVRQCDLQLQTATDGSVVFEVKITGRKADELNVTHTPVPAAADSSGRVCFYPAQLLSYFINLRHPSVSHDAELSMFRSASLSGARMAPRDSSDDSDSDIAVEVGEEAEEAVGGNLRQPRPRDAHGFQTAATSQDSDVDHDDVWLLGDARNAATRAFSFSSLCFTLYPIFKLAFALLN